MDKSTTAGPLSNDYPIMVVTYDTWESTILLTKLICEDSTFENIPLNIMHCHDSLSGNRGFDLLKRFNSMCSMVGLPTRVDIECFQASNDGTPSILLLEDLCEEISDSKEMMELFIDDCIEMYNMTPIFVSPTMFTGGKAEEDVGAIVLHCGYVIIFGDSEDVPQADMLSRRLYALPQYDVERRAFMECYHQMCDFELQLDLAAPPEDHPYNQETEESHMFIDRTRPDNLLRVFKKRIFKSHYSPSSIRMLPEVLDHKRDGKGWLSDKWYRIADKRYAEDGFMY